MPHQIKYSQRNRRKKCAKEKIDSKVPVHVTIIEPEDGKCPTGHSGITPIGRRYVRKSSHVVQAYTYLEKIYEQTYKCEQCAQDTGNIWLVEIAGATSLVST